LGGVYFDSGGELGYSQFLHLLSTDFAFDIPEQHIQIDKGTEIFSDSGVYACIVVI